MEQWKGAVQMRKLMAIMGTILAFVLVAGANWKILPPLTK
jgi:hypothetical protein